MKHICICRVKQQWNHGNQLLLMIELLLVYPFRAGAELKGDVVVGLWNIYVALARFIYHRLSFTVGDYVLAFRVKLGANDLNYVDVPLNSTHLVTLCITASLLSCRAFFVRLFVISVLYLQCSCIIYVFIICWLSVYLIFTFHLSCCVVLSHCHWVLLHFVVVYFILPLLAIYILLYYHNVHRFWCLIIILICFVCYDCEMWPSKVMIHIHGFLLYRFSFL